jgi:hypothetical protein
MIETILTNLSKEFLNSFFQMLVIGLTNAIITVFFTEAFKISWNSLSKKKLNNVLSWIVNIFSIVILSIASMIVFGTQISILYLFYYGLSLFFITFSASKVFYVTIFKTIMNKAKHLMRHSELENILLENEIDKNIKLIDEIKKEKVLKGKLSE